MPAGAPFAPAKRAFLVEQAYEEKIVLLVESAGGSFLLEALLTRTPKVIRVLL
jgi:hypothetical protein